MNSPPELKIVFICSSQFSGSTLASFILNNHTDVATIGHTMGWPYKPGEDFRCSCGRTIEKCVLFQKIRIELEAAGLPFDPRDFGTRFKLANNERLNGILLEWIPGLHFNAAERFRDFVVNRIPRFSAQLCKQQQSNYILMRTVLRHLGASCYLDNSHSPYRMRTLSRNPRFELYPIHLVRDPRGVSLSLMRNSALSVENAVEAWISHQSNIMRVARHVRRPLVITYEQLCTSTNEALAVVYRYCGLDPQPFEGDFKSAEHHILGNRMRLSSGTINLDEKWRAELSQADRQIIEDRLVKYAKRHHQSPLAGLIGEYLETS